MQPSSVTPTPPSVSPSRKRSRAALTTKTKLDAPPPRRLRMRLDHSERIWAGRCGCKSPHCMANDYEFSSDTGISDDSESSDSDSDTHDEDSPSAEPHPTRHDRPPQDPSDLVPMMLHLMLMM